MFTMKRVFVLGLTLAHGLSAAPFLSPDSPVNIPAGFEYEMPVLMSSDKVIHRVERPGIASKVEGVGAGAVDAVGDAIKGTISGRLYALINTDVLDSNHYSHALYVSPYV